ncbi:MAG: cysteine hydrolase [Proteobacteria bacterium]|nr:cysteine hydrolase [Burkholderiales bacterium]
MLDTLAKKVAPSHTAVLVVDMQNEFIEDGGLRGREGDDLSSARALVPRVRRFLQQTRAAGVQVIYVQAVYNSDTDQYISDVWKEQDLRRRRSGRPEDQCREGSWNAQICADLAPAAADMVVQKRRYCAFEGTGLDMVLRGRGIRTVVVTGMATDICVESTVRSAFVKDYYVVLTSDCTTTYSEEAHERTLRLVHRFYGEVAATTEIVDCWTREER